jgi:hypothetical protein
MPDQLRHDDRKQWLCVFAFLLAIAGLGAYARLKGITLVGHAGIDDYTHYKWAYAWLQGDHALYGAYRLTYPFLGSLALRLFGLNDYSIHLFYALVGIANIFLTFLFAYLVTRSRLTSCIVTFFLAWSRRVVEYDRMETAPAPGLFLFLLAAILIVLYVRRDEDGSARGHAAGWLLLLCSAMSLCLACHTHWEISFTAPAFVALLLLHCHAEGRGFLHFLKLSFFYTFSYFIPVILGALYFGPMTVYNNIFIEKVVQHKIYAAAWASDTLKLFVHDFKSITAGPLGVEFINIIFPFIVYYMMRSLIKYIRYPTNITNKAQKKSLFFCFFVWLIYFISTFVSGVNLQERHSAFFYPLVCTLAVVCLKEFYDFLKLKYGIRVSIGCIFVVFTISIAQHQCLEIFTDRYQKNSSVSVYKMIAAELAGRVDQKNRILIVPYIVRDFKYQIFAQPSYMDHYNIDYIYDFTTDFEFPELMAKRNIRYIVWLHKAADARMAELDNFPLVNGLAYGAPGGTLTPQMERQYIDAFLASARARTVLHTPDIEIYDIGSGR